MTTLQLVCCNMYCNIHTETMLTAFLVGAHGGRSGHFVVCLVALSFSKLLRKVFPQ